MTTMRIGTILPLAEGDGPGRTPTWDEILQFAQHAEAVGADSIWVYDHLYSNEPGSPPRGMHEAWSVLSALAVATRHVELGQLVMCVSFRNPALLAKMAAAVDEICGGRLTLGLGAGWHDEEYRAFGYPTDHKVSRFEEALEIIVRLLSGEAVTYAGRYHTVNNAVLLPPPERRIPILIAAKGPRMWRLTARHADAWNTAWFTQPDERFQQRLTDFEAALKDAGKERSSVRRTVGIVVDGADTPSAAKRMADAFSTFSQHGVDDAIVLLQPMTLASLDRMREGMVRWRS